MPPPPAIFWRRRARCTALRYNLGCVLEAFLPAFLGLSAVFACVLIALRERGPVGRSAWVTYAFGVLLCLLVAVWRARARFFTISDALVRLDWHLGLHNRLSAAAAGIGEFPVPRPTSDGFSFRWRRLAAPAAGAIALVWVAAVVPLSRHALAFVPATPPVAWTQAAKWIDDLQKSDLLQEPALAEVRERLEQLREQPPRDWYSQSSLEAGDSLRNQTAQSIDSLQRNLSTALNDMERLERFTDKTSPSELKGVQANLDNALKGLEMGNLPLNRDLLDQLKQVDLSKAKMLTQAQLDELKRRLKDGAQICKVCLADGEFGKELKDAALLVADAASPKNPSPGPGGGGPALLTLNEKPVDLATTAKDAVSNPDLDHALPGDVIAVGKGEHTVDPSKYTGPVSGGTITSPGEGGDAVWRNDLTPAEREVLKSFFK